MMIDFAPSGCLMSPAWPVTRNLLPEGEPAPENTPYLKEDIFRGYYTNSDGAPRHVYAVNVSIANWFPFPPLEIMGEDEDPETAENDVEEIVWNWVVDVLYKLIETANRRGETDYNGPAPLWLRGYALYAANVSGSGLYEFRDEIFSDDFEKAAARP